MATLTNPNTWYDVAVSGEINSSFGGTSLKWKNVIQAMWTSRSGSTYYVQYRCVVRKISGTSTGMDSIYNAYKIAGTGATTSEDYGYSGHKVLINYATTGDNPKATISGTITGTSGSVNGGVQLGYYGTTWGSTTLSGSITLPTVGPNKPTVTATVTSDTSIDITYGTSSFNASSGTVSLYGDTTPNFTPDVSNLLETKTTVGNSTFTHSNLTTGDTYYYKVVADNGTQTSTSDELTVLLVFIGMPKIYGSVSGDTKKIEKLYGSVNGDTKKILKVYGSVNGQTKRIF